MKAQNYDSAYKPTWCPGCGNYGINMALKNALSELKIPTHELAMVFDIGCAGNSANFYSSYNFHALHGRPVPVACGIKLANKKLKVIAISGDGGGYGEGGNHFIHTCRTNIDITYIVHDNKDYGLTTGQTSPTSEKGYESRSTPYGNKLIAFNPILAAIAAGATFVAQGYSAEINHLKDIIKKAIAHKGFSLVNIYQPCVTFNKVYTYDYFNERVEKMRYNSRSRGTAMEKAAKIYKNKKLPIGVFYQEKRDTLEKLYPNIYDKDVSKPEVDKKTVESLIDSFAY